MNFSDFSKKNLFSSAIIMNGTKDNFSSGMFEESQ